MILIFKPAAPMLLLDKGSAATQMLCEAYENGDTSFDFDRSIYADATVKNALRQAQHNKCAFCESFFAHTGRGDVEHFRPKRGYKQKEKDKLKRPGYYWLAYKWSNLFYSCQLCNQRFKRNLFPLKDGRSRARSHKHAIAKEEPLLVDPSVPHPGHFIGFREEYAFAVGGCIQGKTTIDVLGLNREELVEVRRDRLATLKELLLLRELLSHKVANCSTPELTACLRAVEFRIQASMEDSGLYAAISRDFVDRAAARE